MQIIELRSLIGLQQVSGSCDFSMLVSRILLHNT